MIRESLSVKKDGFTLIEVLVVIVIIGITSTMMIPNYQNYLKKSEQAQCDKIAYEIREAIYAKMMVGFLDSYYVYPLKSTTISVSTKPFIDDIDGLVYERFLRNALKDKPFAYYGTIFFQKAKIDETRKGIAIFEIKCRDKTKISFSLLVSDFDEPSKDTAIFISLTYTHLNNCETTLSFNEF